MTFRFAVTSQTFKLMCETMYSYYKYQLVKLTSFILIITHSFSYYPCKIIDVHNGIPLCY